MAPKVDVLEIFIKTAAISGIGLVWFNFTIKSFKMAWKNHVHKRRHFETRLNM